MSGGESKDPGKASARKRKKSMRVRTFSGRPSRSQLKFRRQVILFEDMAKYCEEEEKRAHPEQNEEKKQAMLARQSLENGESKVSANHENEFVVHRDVMAVERGAKNEAILQEIANFFKQVAASGDDSSPPGGKSKMDRKSLDPPSAEQKSTQNADLSSLSQELTDTAASTSEEALTAKKDKVIFMHAVNSAKKKIAEDTALNLDLKTLKKSVAEASSLHDTDSLAQGLAKSCMERLKAHYKTALEAAVRKAYGENASRSQFEEYAVKSELLAICEFENFEQEADETWLALARAQCALAPQIHFANNKDQLEKYQQRRAICLDVLKNMVKVISKLFGISMSVLDTALVYKLRANGIGILASETWTGTVKSVFLTILNYTPVANQGLAWVDFVLENLTALSIGALTTFLYVAYWIWARYKNEHKNLTTTQRMGRFSSSIFRHLANEKLTQKILEWNVEPGVQPHWSLEWVTAPIMAMAITTSVWKTYESFGRDPVLQAEQQTRADTNTFYGLIRNAEEKQEKFLNLPLDASDEQRSKAFNDAANARRDLLQATRKVNLLPACKHAANNRRWTLFCRKVAGVCSAVSRGAIRFGLGLGNTYDTYAMRKINKLMFMRHTLHYVVGPSIFMFLQSFFADLLGTSPGTSPQHTFGTSSGMPEGNATGNATGDFSGIPFATGASEHSHENVGFVRMFGNVLEFCVDQENSVQYPADIVNTYRKQIDEGGHALTPEESKGLEQVEQIQRDLFMHRPISASQPFALELAEVAYRGALKIKEMHSVKMMINSTRIAVGTTNLLANSAMISGHLGASFGNAENPGSNPPSLPLQAHNMGIYNFLSQPTLQHIFSDLSGRAADRMLDLLIRFGTFPVGYLKSDDGRAKMEAELKIVLVEAGKQFGKLSKQVVNGYIDFVRSSDSTILTLPYDKPVLQNANKVLNWMSWHDSEHNLTEDRKTYFNKKVETFLQKSLSEQAADSNTLYEAYQEGESYASLYTFAYPNTVSYDLQNKVKSLDVLLKGVEKMERDTNFVTTELNLLETPNWRVERQKKLTFARVYNFMTEVLDSNLQNLSLFKDAFAKSVRLMGKTPDDRYGPLARALTAEEQKQALEIEAPAIQVLTGQKMLRGSRDVPALDNDPVKLLVDRLTAQNIYFFDESIVWGLVRFQRALQSLGSKLTSAQWEDGYAKMLRANKAMVELQAKQANTEQMSLFYRSLVMELHKILDMRDDDGKSLFMLNIPEQNSPQDAWKLGTLIGELDNNVVHGLKNILGFLREEAESLLTRFSQEGADSVALSVRAEPIFSALLQLSLKEKHHHLDNYNWKLDLRIRMRYKTEVKKEVNKMDGLSEEDSTLLDRLEQAVHKEANASQEQQEEEGAAMAPPKSEQAKNQSTTPGIPQLDKLSFLPSEDTGTNSGPATLPTASTRSTQLDTVIDTNEIPKKMRNALAGPESADAEKDAASAESPDNWQYKPSPATGFVDDSLSAAIGPSDTLKFKTTDKSPIGSSQPIKLVPGPALNSKKSKKEPSAPLPKKINVPPTEGGFQGSNNSIKITTGRERSPGISTDTTPKKADSKSEPSTGDAIKGNEFWSVQNLPPSAAEGVSPNTPGQSISDPTSGPSTGDEISGNEYWRRQDLLPSAAEGGLPNTPGQSDLNAITNKDDQAVINDMRRSKAEKRATESNGDFASVTAQQQGPTPEMKVPVSTNSTRPEPGALAGGQPLAIGHGHHATLPLRFTESAAPVVPSVMHREELAEEECVDE